MGSNAAPPPTRSRQPWSGPALLLLGLGLAGCQPLDRLDVLDRVFDPQGYAERHSQPPPPAPPVLPDSTALPPAGPVAEAPPAPAPEPASEPPAPERRARTAALRVPPSAQAVPLEGGDARLRSIVQQHHWLARFWSELTASQQRQVERRFQRAGTPAAGAAERWDVMGLTDRARLVFGGAGAPKSPAPLERSEGADWAASP